ncbi:MAG: hypothetical protein ING19_00510 [Azospirillum sp.]|nr:hypothetical protein [Azospirillum sp.]
MGSYHYTCGITNLPILEGDPVVLFPVQQTKRSVSALPTNAGRDYVPIFSAIGATYADYGMFDSDHPAASRFVEAVNTAHRGTRKFDWRSLQKATFKDGEDGLLLPFTNFDGQRAVRDSSGIAFFAVHKRVYESVCAAAIANDDVVGFRSSMRFHVNGAAYNLIAERTALRRLKREREAAGRTPESGAKDFADESAMNFITRFYRRLLNDSTPFVDAIDVLPPEGDAALEYAKAFHRGDAEFDVEAFIDAIPKEILDAAAFHWAMTEMRKTYAPPSGGGSQSFALDLHAAAIEQAKHQLLRIKKSFGEDCEDEAEENPSSPTPRAF